MGIDPVQKSRQRRWRQHSLPLGGWLSLWGLGRMLQSPAILFLPITGETGLIIQHEGDI
jgi:hypothetical protein